MQIIYLVSTLEDFEWMSHYYGSVFAEGWANMQSQLGKTEILLSSNPFMGRILEDFDDLRILNIVQTPFALIYRVTNTHIEVLRVWDQRQDKSKLRI